MDEGRWNALCSSELYGEVQTDVQVRADGKVQTDDSAEMHSLRSRWMCIWMGLQVGLHGEVQTVEQTGVLVGVRAAVQVAAQTEEQAGEDGDAP